jgi:hypothetical protein
MDNSAKEREGMMNAAVIIAGSEQNCQVDAADEF